MKHKEIIAKLTLEEKCCLLSGRDFWSTYGIKAAGVPSVSLSDGPHGLRKERKDAKPGTHDSYPATCFPTAATAANSWDPDLGEEIGKAIAEEAASRGVEVLLGPGMNIKRNPLCGRNFEYFSEDPYLAGKMAAGYIRGIQSQGISACPKHFAANNMELRRLASDSIVDERTLREIYLTGFEIAVKEADPKCIMASYNEVNGVYANENRHLLQEILRDEWGFSGFVVSDWGAGDDFTEGVRAGSNLEMPGNKGDSAWQLVKAVTDGRISESTVDERVDELLDVVLSTYGSTEPRKGRPFDMDAHHAAAMRACEQSIVLLKNDSGILPLKKGTRVAVIGDFAFEPRYQGAGSSLVNATRVERCVDVIKDFPLDIAGFERGFLRSGKKDPELVKRACELAAKADAVLFYMGLDEASEAENLDRKDMKIHLDQIELLSALAEVNENIIAVMAAGSAVEMPWESKCRAIIHGYLSGQAGASAILRVITGETDPSGKLAETYPLSYEDVPSAPYFPAKERNVEYREGLYVGYRYYETAGVPVRYPFGYGLSYTTFSYSGIRASRDKVSFTLTNTGERDGAEIAEVYVSALDPRVLRPARELKGFCKVFLKAGESRRVEIKLDDKAFRYFSTKTDRFEEDGGKYEIQVGASSQDIRLRETIEIAGTGAELPYGPDELPHYRTGDIRDVPDEEFRKLYGREIPDGKWHRTLGLNDSIYQIRTAKSLKARLIWKYLKKRIDRSMKRGEPDLDLVFLFNMPFRAFSKISGGLFSLDMCRALVTMANGHTAAFLAGACAFAVAYLRQRKTANRSDMIK